MIEPIYDENTLPASESLDLLKLNFGNLLLIDYGENEIDHSSMHVISKFIRNNKPNLRLSSYIEGHLLRLLDAAYRYQQ